MASVMWVNERNASGGQTMKKYYYKFWVPFVANKRRILVLAIASYLAMC
jgi:hypothetical protein